MQNRYPLRYLILCLVIILFLPALSLRARTCLPEELKGLDDFILKGMADYGIPGMAVSVVKDGKIYYEKGYGVRKTGENAKVDQHTVFGVASTSKAMTVAALAMLVDEGKIGWNDRVRDHLPWFELSDPWVSDHVTIRDLLSHRVGIGRMTGNRLVFMPDRDRRAILDHIKYQPLEIPFRSGYLYSNVMYMVAGLIIEAVEGISWDEYLPQRLFAPLNMSSSSVSVTQISENDNAAWPHQEIEGTVRPIPRRNFDNVGPAASVNASAHDMAQWMLLNLGEPGKYKDKTLISRETMNEIFQPQYVFPAGNPFSTSFSGYAMGWNSGTYGQYRIFQHGGATDGINSMIVLLPEKDIGIFVAGNLFCELRPAVISRILDALLGIERGHDWHEMFFEQYQKEKATALLRKKEIDDARIPGTSPVLDLHEYTGCYYDKVYDDLEVKLGEDGRLELHFWGDPEMVAYLEHWHYDTFRAAWKNPAMREKFVTFDIGQDGKVRQVRVNFTLRPLMIEAGIYPADYFRIVEYIRVGD